MSNGAVATQNAQDENYRVGMRIIKVVQQPANDAPLPRCFDGMWHAETDLKSLLVRAAKYGYRATDAAKAVFEAKYHIMEQECRDEAERGWIAEGNDPAGFDYEATPISGWDASCIDSVYLDVNDLIDGQPVLDAIEDAFDADRDKHSLRYNGTEILTFPDGSTLVMDEYRSLGYGIPDDYEGDEYRNAEIVAFANTR